MTIQLSMFENSGDFQHPEKTPTISGDFQHPEKKLLKIYRFLNKGKPRDGSGSIQIYNKGGRSYYHYCYWNGWESVNKHICGGRVGNPKVESRVKIVKMMIDREAPVSEILNLISAFK